jgi:uncharacterized Zn-binding protein involved in type VI secretion
MAARGVARIGEDSVMLTGILIASSSNSVFVNNKMAAVKGSLVFAHLPCPFPGGFLHCAAKVLGNSTTVYVDKKGIARKGDGATCGDKIGSGSNNVFSG